MVSSGKGRFFKRTDDKYLIYLPVYVAEDSMFPFKDYGAGARGGIASIAVKGTFTMGEKKLEFTSTPITRKETVAKTVSGVCRLFRRKDGKYLIYLSKPWCLDSMFPFKGSDSIDLNVSFKLGVKKLFVEEWREPVSEESD